MSLQPAIFCVFCLALMEDGCRALRQRLGMQGRVSLEEIDQHEQHGRVLAWAQDTSQAGQPDIPHGGCSPVSDGGRGEGRRWALGIAAAAHPHREGLVSQCQQQPTLPQCALGQLASQQRTQLAGQCGPLSDHLQPPRSIFGAAVLPTAQAPNADSHRPLRSIAFQLTTARPILAKIALDMLHCAITTTSASS